MLLVAQSGSERQKHGAPHDDDDEGHDRPERGGTKLGTNFERLLQKMDSQFPGN